VDGSACQRVRPAGNAEVSAEAHVEKFPKSIDGYSHVQVPWGSARAQPTPTPVKQPKARKASARTGEGERNKKFKRYDRGMQRV
jgi:hypothetical protein